MTPTHPEFKIAGTRYEEKKKRSHRETLGDLAFFYQAIAQDIIGGWRYFCFCFIFFTFRNNEGAKNLGKTQKHRSKEMINNVVLRSLQIQWKNDSEELLKIVNKTIWWTTLIKMNFSAVENGKWDLLIKL